MYGEIQKARALIAAGGYEEAELLYRKITKASPGDERVLAGAALSLLMTGRETGALACMSAVSRIRPGAAYPLAVTGAVLEGDGRRAEALGLYEAALRADPSDPATHVGRARVLLGRGDEKGCARAMSECGTSASIGGHAPLADERISSLLQDARAGRTPALRAGDEATFMPGLSGLLDMALGAGVPGRRASDLDSLRLAGAAERAEHLDWAERELKKSPCSPVALCTKSVVLEAEGRPAEAAACYDRLIGCDPGGIEGYAHKILALQDAGDRDGIKECIRAALKATPKDSAGASVQESLRTWRGAPRAKAAIGITAAVRAVSRHVARRCKDLDASRGEVSASVVITRSAGIPSDIDGALGEAARLAAAGRYSEADALYESVCRASPRDERGLCGRTLALAAIDEPRAAAECMREAADLGAPYAHGVLGAVAEESGDLDEALARYGAMIRAEPSEADAYVRKAQILLDCGEEKEAAETLSACAASAALDGEPKAVERLRRIFQDARAGRPPELKTADSATFVPGLRALLDRAVGSGLPGLEGPDVDALNLAGSRERVEALAVTERLIAADPLAIGVWCARIVLLSDEGRAAEALRCCEDVNAGRRGFMPAYALKLALLQDAGDRDGVKECFRAALDAAPMDEGNALEQWRLGEWRDRMEKDPRIRFRAAGLARAVTWHVARRRAQNYEPGAGPARSSGAQARPAGGGLFPPGLLGGAPDGAAAAGFPLGGAQRRAGKPRKPGRVRAGRRR